MRNSQERPQMQTIDTFPGTQGKTLTGTMSAKVHRIDVFNFKSYSGHISIGPFRDFTCVVGPNGAGKSNVMDALSFVLGANAQTLRGQDPLDFICRKATKKECSVTLVLRHSDGSDTLLTRSLDSKGAVKVSVDKIHVSEKEFGVVLRKFRLGSRIGTFLVFQHEVDAVAHKKPAELTELFEQISGSIELKEEYQQRRKALDAANETLAKASLERRGALAEANQLRLQKREAERFEEITVKQQQQRRDVALVELFFIENHLAKQKQELTRLQEVAKAMQKEMTTEDDVRNMKKQYAEKHKLYMEQLKSNRSLNIDLRDKKTNLDRLAVSLEHLQKKLETQRQDLAQVQSATAVRSKETQRLEEQLKQQEALLKNFEEQCAKEDAAASAQGSLTAAQMTEYRRLKKDADCETISKRQEMDSTSRQRESLLEGLRQAKAALEALDTQKKDIQQHIERTQEHMVEIRRKDGDLLDAFKSSKERETSVAAALQATIQSSKETADELQKVEQQLHELRHVKDDNRMSLRIAEALQSLKSVYPGIRGRLVDLCEIPNPKYRNAVTVAFGKNLEGVVVDTTETALSCVRYLKEQRLVSMTFLPLNSVQGKAVDDSLRTFGGSTKPIIDVVKFDPTLEPAVRYAVGQTLVCDDMTEARRIAFGQPDGARYKVVTVDGTVLLKNGSIQGGLASIQSRSKKWDEKRYDELKQARDRLLRDQSGKSEGDVAKMRIELRDLQSRMEFQQKRHEANETEIKSLQTKVANLGTELAKLEKDGAEQITKRVTQYEANLAKCDAEIGRLQKDIRAVEETIFGEFQKRVKIPNVSELEQREVRQAKQRSERRQQLQLVIQKLKTSIDQEASRVGVRKVTDVQDLLSRTTKEIETCKKDFDVYSGITSKIEKKQEALQGGIAQSKAELDRLEDEIRRHAKSSEEEVRKLALARKQVNAVQAACETLRHQRISLFQKCRMEETELPVIDANDVAGAKRPRSSDVVQSSTGKKARGVAADGSGDALVVVTMSEPFSTYSETEATRAKGAKEVQVCIDFSSLSDALRQHAKDAPSFAAFKHKTDVALDQLQRELESIAPNMKATTRFGNTESKVNTSATHLEEAREATRKALTAFLRIKEQRVERFMATFEKISENVDRVYRELTLGTRAHDVHGSAYLTIEDAEEPYNGGVKYHATPPMKRFMAMDLLSGGERTMAALALLFAINAVSPTPFFVLDEVDAALDIGNVVKLAAYLKSHSHQCQFIVVSLKDQLYHLADGLVGIYKDRTNESSGVLTLDLAKLPTSSNATE